MSHATDSLPPTVKNLAIALPNSVVMTAQAQRKVTLVTAMKIDSHMMYEEAAKELQAILAKIDEFETQRTDITRPILQSKRMVDDLYRGPTELLEQARDALKASMLAYRKVLAERQRLADQKRLEDARKEQERLNAEAAATQAQADKEAAELRAKAEAAAAAGNGKQAARLESKADSREATGAAIAAELQMSAAAVVYTPAPALAQPKAAGISTRTKWKAECTDKAALVAYVAANPAFLHFLDVNETALNQFAVSTKGAAEIGGVRFFPDQVLASRRA